MNHSRALPRRHLWLSALFGTFGVEERNALTGAPDAAHPGHDHRAARPVFLHIGRIADPHRVRAREIPGIDVGLPVGRRIDENSPRRPPSRRCEQRIGDWRWRLNGPRALRRLRLCCRREERQNPRKSPQYRRCPDTHLAAPVCGPHGLRLRRRRQPHSWCGDLTFASISPRVPRSECQIQNRTRRPYLPVFPRF